jgi:N-acetylmuramoyl-L-alanine amidase CwlA
MNFTKIIIILFVFQIFAVCPVLSEESQTDDCEKVVAALGTTISSNMFMSYVSLTLMVNDSRDTTYIDNYSSILESIKGSLENVKTQIEEIEKIDIISDDDKDVVRNLKHLYKQLIEEIELFEKYIESKKSKDYSKLVLKHDNIAKAMKIFLLENTEN